MNTLVLSQKLFERYESVQPVNNYYGLLALFALAQTAYESKDKKAIDKCVNMLKLYPDGTEHPYYNFEVYRVGGAGKAWLLNKGYFGDEKDVIKEYAEKTLEAPRSRENIMCWPTDADKNKIWIDTVYAVTPFMLYAGLALKEEKYIDFAAEQCYNMYEFFLDKTCGLLHQSRGFMPDKTRVSSDHWSRGNGWGYLGLTELVKSLPKDSARREKAERYFKDMSHALLLRQTDKGTWQQELMCENSWIESSGTALFLYGFGAGLRLGLLEESVFYQPYKKGIEALGKFITKDFSTLMSCCGCLCPGTGEAKGSVKAYLTEVWPMTDEPHSFGAFMLALTEAYRNGITCIDI